MREALRGKTAVVSGEIKGKAGNFAEVVSKTANIAGEVVSKTAHFKEALKASITSFGSRAHAGKYAPIPRGRLQYRSLLTQQAFALLILHSEIALEAPHAPTLKKIDADVARCDCTESIDPLELPARLQSPSKHRQAGTSPRCCTYRSLRSDVDRDSSSDRSTGEPGPEKSIPLHSALASIPSASSSSIRDSSREPGYEEQSDGTRSTCAFSTPPADQSEPSIAPDHAPQHPSTQALEMSGRDHSELEGDDGGEEGFVVPRLGFEGRGAGEGEQDGEEQGGSSTTSSNAGSSQAHRTPAAPDCPPDSSSSLRASQNSQSQGDAAGKERMGSAGAEGEIRSGVDSAGDGRSGGGAEGRDGRSGGGAEGVDGRSGGGAEGGDGRSGGGAEGGDGRSGGGAGGGNGASLAAGWHPTPPAVTQSPTKIDADVAACNWTEITDPLELPARVQSPSKHRQAAASPRSFTHSSLWSDVDHFFPSDRSASELSSEGSIPPHSTPSHASAARFPSASSSVIRDSIRESIRDSISEPGYEEQPAVTHSTCALSTPPPDQSEPLVPRDQGPISFTHPIAQVLEMSGPDRPKLEGDENGLAGFVVPRLGYEECDAGEGEETSESTQKSPRYNDSESAGFVVPRLGYEECDAGEGEEGGAEQGRGGRRRAEEAELSMNLWLMGSSYEGSSTTSTTMSIITTNSTVGGVFAGIPQAQRAPAAPDYTPDSSSSLRASRSSQSPGDAVGKERVGRAGAAMSAQRSGVEAGRDVQSPYGVSKHLGEAESGRAEEGDGAPVSEGWHPTSPVVVQSPYGVSTQLRGAESARAEEWDGQSDGTAEGGDGAPVSEGWHPTSPVIVQSPYGVSTHTWGEESGRAEECGDMDRVWEEMYVQRECASLPTSPRDSRRALPAIKRLLTIRRVEFVERLSSRDSFSSTDSRRARLSCAVCCRPLKALPLKALPLKALPLKARYLERAAMRGCRGSGV
ncbi:unnamed protein product [Closterium sp. Yama58-4]|nr:unnamed protein product [Closterium sp. Yama58-4]